MLEPMSFNVTLTESGKKGVSLLEQGIDGEPFDLLILDWQMAEMDGIEAAAKIRGLSQDAGVAEKSISNMPIIMTTAYDLEELARQSEEIGINGYLQKPITPLTLFDAIMTAFGRKSLDSGRGRRRDDTVEGLDQIQGARILLAEDNEINQQVAQEILEGAGFVLDIAEDGEKVLEMYQAAEYDVILMDINMPNMDGLEATHRIRVLEEDSQSEIADQKSRIPIIAMTASAMTQDIEMTRKAGMDGHVAKPIDVKELMRTLIEWIEPGDRSERSAFRAQERDRRQRSEIRDRKLQKHQVYCRRLCLGSILRRG